MTTPVGIQRTRRKGSKLTSPNGLPIVCVDRSTKWGNPFIEGIHAKTKGECVEFFHQMITDGIIIYFSFNNPRVMAESVNEQRRYMAHFSAHKNDLTNKNLACWCALDASCHRTPLLEAVASR